MPDLSWPELFVVAVIALLVIGPKEIPTLLYGVGRAFRRLTYMRYALSNQFEDFMQMQELQKETHNNPVQSDPEKEADQIPMTGHHPSFIIYPAIDLKDGQCVRLYKGDMAQATVYNHDPAAQAKAFRKSGFSYLHIVDLNGAIDGKPVNADAVKDILKAVDIPVQLGGGIRTLEHIQGWLDAGVARVILGTVAVNDPDLVRTACQKFPGQIVIGLDARGDKVAVKGWVEDSEATIFDMAKKFEDAGAAAIIYTDIDRDGTGAGLNIDMTRRLAAHTSIPVIASGGVGSNADIIEVQDRGIPGVIVGKALYEGKIRIQDLRL